MAASEGLILVCSVLCCALCGGFLGKSFYLIVLCFLPLLVLECVLSAVLNLLTSVCTLKFSFFFTRIVSFAECYDIMAIATAESPNHTLI